MPRTASLPRATNEGARLEVLGVTMIGPSVDQIYRASEHVYQAHFVSQQPGSNSSNLQQTAATSSQPPQTTLKGRPKMSAAARLKLSNALKARHAAIKAGQAKKPTGQARAASANS